MMKRMIFPCLLILTICICTSVASLSEADDAADGLLETGEYDGSDVTLENAESLIIAGGGADRINAYDYSNIEVQCTSMPLSNSSGIYDIFLYDNSNLLYLGGVTEEIAIGNDATAVLKGGTISALNIYHGPKDSCTVTIYCQDGYTKTTGGISGLWADGTSFDIDFIDHYPYTTAGFVNVEIVPEPTTLALLGIGGFLIRRKK